MGSCPILSQAPRFPDTCSSSFTLRIFRFRTPWLACTSQDLSSAARSSAGETPKFGLEKCRSEGSQVPQCRNAIYKDERRGWHVVLDPWSGSVKISCRQLAPDGVKAAGAQPNCLWLWDSKSLPGAGETAPGLRGHTSRGRSLMGPDLVDLAYGFHASPLLLSTLLDGIRGCLTSSSHPIRGQR